MSTPSFFNKHDVTSLTSIDKLFKEIDKFQGSDPGPIYFRGQSNESWPLTPTIGRRNQYWHAGRKIARFTKGQERDLFHRFRRYSHLNLGKSLNPWEALFLARHHGLPVRLLDWTSNPLIALYNAVEFSRENKDSPEKDKDCAIWAFVRKEATRNDIDVLTDSRFPLDIPGVKIVYPSYVSPRMVAQSGCFTMHDYPWRNLNEDKPANYKSKDFDILRLKKWIIPKGKRAFFINRLERMAINSRTVFPDLDGLAKGLWQLEVLRKR